MTDVYLRGEEECVGKVDKIACLPEEETCYIT